MSYMVNLHRELIEANDSLIQNRNLFALNKLNIHQSIVKAVRWSY